MLAIAGFAQLAATQLLDPAVVHWPLGIHTQLFAAAASVLGYQTLLFAVGAVLVRHLAGLDAPHPREQWVRRFAQSPWLLACGLAATAVGLVLCVGLAPGLEAQDVRAEEVGLDGVAQVAHHRGDDQAGRVGGEHCAGADDGGVGQ